MKLARLGVLIDEEARKKRQCYGVNVFECYIEEILEHAGVMYTRISDIRALDVSMFDLVIASVVPETERAADLLWEYAEAGGALISYGGLGFLARRLSCRQRPRIGTSYVRLSGFGTIPTALRCLSAQPWEAEGESTADSAVTGTLHADSPQGRVICSALQSFTVGQGEIHRWTVDIPTTVVHLQ
ncbi:MAG: hypothetical protein ACQEXX_25280 [Bacillota bacterium]